MGWRYLPTNRRGRVAVVIVLLLLFLNNLDFQGFPVRVQRRLLLQMVKFIVFVFFMRLLFSVVFIIFLLLVLTLFILLLVLTLFMLI